MRCSAENIHCADVVLQRHQVTYLVAGVARAGVNSEVARPALSSIVQKQNVELGEAGKALDCAWEKNKDE